MTALALALALTLGSDAEWHPVSPLLPRSATLGLDFNSPALSPVVRLTWEATIYEQPRNHLVLVFNAGTGGAVMLPSAVASIWQHVAWAGLGYQSTRETLHWGFSFGGGVLWYRAGYPRTSTYKFENQLLGYSEGRIQVGAKVTRKLIIGGYVGFGSPWDFSGPFPAKLYLGGITFGLFGGWR